MCVTSARTCSKRLDYFAALRNEWTNEPCHAGLVLQDGEVREHRVALHNIRPRPEETRSMPRTFPLSAARAPRHSTSIHCRKAMLMTSIGLLAALAACG